MEKHSIKLTLHLLLAVKTLKTQSRVASKNGAVSLNVPMPMSFLVTKLVILHHRKGENESYLHINQNNELKLAKKKLYDDI